MEARDVAETRNCSHKKTTHPRRGACGKFNSWIQNKTIRHAPFDCKVWACPHCAEKHLRPRLLVYMQKHAEECGALHVLIVPDTRKNWITAYNRLRKRRYFRLRIGNHWHIVANKPFSLPTGESSQKFTGKALEKLLQKLAKSVDYGKSPFSSCRAWPIEPKRVKKGYEMLGTTNVSPKAFVEAACKLGINSKFDGPVAVTFTTSKDDWLACINLGRSIQFAEKCRLQKPQTSYPNVKPDLKYDNSFQAGSGTPRSRESKSAGPPLSG